MSEREPEAERRGGREPWDEAEREQVGEREPKDERGGEKGGGNARAGRKEEQRDRSRRRSKRRTHPAAFSLATGFFAGLIWGFARWFAVSLNFTRVPQAFLVDGWVKRSSLHSAWWHWTGLLLFIVMSMIAALVYWLVLGRLRGPWPGIAFGAAWWALLFLIVGPPTGTTESVRVLGWNSIFTELCLYLVWGLFIGYSFAFEFHDEAAREPSGESGKKGRPQPAH